MQRTRRLAFVAAGLALSATVGASAASKPILRVLDREPLVVRGESFKAGERVTVIALTGLGPRFARVTAYSRRFRVTFRLPDSGCAAAFAVRARGAAGSAAMVRLGETTSCIPPPRD